MGQSKIKIPPWHNIGRGSTEGKQSEYDPNQPGLQGYQEEFIETENITMLLLRNNAKLYFPTISLSSFVNSVICIPQWLGSHMGEKSQNLMASKTTF